MAATNSACACGSQGALSTVLIKASTDDDNPADFSTGARRFDFIGEDIGLVETLLGGRGLTGRLDGNINTVRDGPAYVRGRLMLHIGPKDLDFFLPYILRGEEVADVHSPGQETPCFDVMVKRDKVTFIYTKCQVNTAMWRCVTNQNSREPQLLELMLDLLGHDELAGTFPASPPSLPDANSFYWLAADAKDGLSLGGNIYTWDSFSLYYSNQLVPIMRASLRPQCIRSQGRMVRFSPVLPLCAANMTALHFSKFDGAGALDFMSDENLGNSLSRTLFTFNRLRGVRRSPQTRGRTETLYRMDLTGWAGDNEDTNPVLKVSNTHP